MPICQGPGCLFSSARLCLWHEKSRNDETNFLVPLAFRSCVSCDTRGHPEPVDGVLRSFLAFLCLYPSLEERYLFRPCIFSAAIFFIPLGDWSSEIDFPSVVENLPTGSPTWGFRTTPHISLLVFTTRTSPATWQQPSCWEQDRSELACKPIWTSRRPA